MRGDGPSHNCHVPRIGPPSFVGFEYAIAIRGKTSAGSGGASPRLGNRNRSTSWRREACAAAVSRKDFKSRFVHGIETVAEIPSSDFPSIATNCGDEAAAGMRVESSGQSRIRADSSWRLGGTRRGRRGGTVRGGVRCWGSAQAMGTLCTWAHTTNLIGSFNRIDAGVSPSIHSRSSSSCHNKIAGLPISSFDGRGDVETFVFWETEHLERVGKYEGICGAIGRHILLQPQFTPIGSIRVNRWH